MKVVWIEAISFSILIIMQHTYNSSQPLAQTLSLGLLDLVKKKILLQQSTKALNKFEKYSRQTSICNQRKALLQMCLLPHSCTVFKFVIPLLYES